MTAKKAKLKVGILSTNNLKVFEKKDKNLIEVDFKTDYDVPLLKKIMGYALQTVRTHGIGLNIWSHVEIDVLSQGDSISEVDVYFMNEEGTSKVDVLGITIELNENDKAEITGFFCIAIQPKTK